jgi:cytoskeletal protein CcmA (bactofilin family)
VAILGSSAKSPVEARVPPAGLSIVAVGMRVNGNLDSDGTVKIEGAVDGNVVTREQVLVSKGGEVHGNIEAREAIIGGTVYGSIRALERVEIQTGATVEGDIATRRIMVAEGAKVNGLVRMGESAMESRPAPSPKPDQGRVPQAAQSLPRASVPVARVAVPPRQPASGSGV